jgi:hypothetical protein
MRHLVDFVSPSRQILGKFLKIRPRPLPSTSLPVHHLLITPSFDTVWSGVTEKALLNKQQTNKTSVMRVLLALVSEVTIIICGIIRD